MNNGKIERKSFRYFFVFSLKRVEHINLLVIREIPQDDL